MPLLSLSEDAEDHFMGKKLISHTIRMDEDMDRWAAQATMQCDCGFSDLVRTALLLAVPQIKACPALLRRLDLDDISKE